MDEAFAAALSRTPAEVIGAVELPDLSVRRPTSWERRRQRLIRRAQRELDAAPGRRRRLLEERERLRARLKLINAALKELSR